MPVERFLASLRFDSREKAQDLKQNFFTNLPKFATKERISVRQTVSKDKHLPPSLCLRE
jgi:hypothetical protein